MSICATVWENPNYKDLDSRSDFEFSVSRLVFVQSKCKMSVKKHPVWCASDQIVKIPLKQCQINDF